MLARQLEGELARALLADVLRLASFIAGDGVARGAFRHAFHPQLLWRLRQGLPIACMLLLAGAPALRAATAARRRLLQLLSVVRAARAWVL